MTFEDFITYFGFSSKITFWGVIAFATSIGIELIPKIKWNPWSSLIKWIGSRFNDKIDKKVMALDNSFNEKLRMLDAKIDNRMETLDQKVDTLQSHLSEYVADFNTKNLQDIRRDILNFCNSCMNGEKHTKEQFDFVIHQCDDYELYIQENHIKNGVIEAAIKEIHRLYEKCIQEHSFLYESEHVECTKESQTI